MIKNNLIILLTTLIVILKIQANERPNVLFIVIDDLNDYISLLQNYPGIKTPNLDKFSKSAMSFSHGYSNGVACRPSRNSLLSGIPPHLTGSYKNNQRAKFPQNVSMLAKQFQLNGYSTFGAGKIYDDREGITGQWNYEGKKHYGPMPHKRNINKQFGLPNMFDYGIWKKKEIAFADSANAHSIIKWLNQNHQKPFFIAYGMIRPHNPWTAPKRFFDMYPIESLVMPEVRANDMDDLPPAAVKMAHNFLGLNKTDVINFMRSPHYKKTVQAYLASISFMDYNLGRVLNALDKSLYKKNTIVSLVADHGYHMGEKEHFGKYGLWEQTTHIAYAWRVPGLTPEKGSVCERTVSL